MTPLLGQLELFAGLEMTEPERSDVAAGAAFVFSRASPDKTRDATDLRSNEDGAMILGLGVNRAVLAVADGLGGQPDGEQASKLALATLAASIKNCTAEHDNPDTVELREGILDGFERANTAVQNLRVGAGTTLAAAEIDGSTIRTYHAGDSMILLVGQRGKLKLQTVSHSPVGYAVESGILAEREAMHHEDRHLISNMVGMRDMRIEIGPQRRLRPRDTILIASDGLFDNMHINEIVQVIRKGPLDRACRKLVEVSDRRMRTPGNNLPCKPDDLTFVAYRAGRN